MAKKKLSSDPIVRYAICSTFPGTFAYLHIDENNGRVGSIVSLRKATTFIAKAEAKACIKRYISWSMDISSNWKVVKITTTVEDA
jgi:hypothetical protein